MPFEIVLSLKIPLLRRYPYAMRTKPTLRERVERMERELETLKQQVAQQVSGGSLTDALHLLETLWGISHIAQPTVPLPEARTRLAQALPPK